MGRITARRSVLKVAVGEDSRRRIDTLAVEEPLEIRVSGRSLTVTMRTPGNDVELATGFLLSEGIIHGSNDFHSAIHCGGPAVGGAENTFNVLDVTLAPDVAPPPPQASRAFFTTSSCGICGKASIEDIRTLSRFDIAGDIFRVSSEALAHMPARLRDQQSVFDKTGGLHGAALIDASSGEVLVAREDVGRHNAVDKVLGWALLQHRIPLRRTVLQVSGRLSFELVQKAAMAAVPMLTAVSAPSSLAVELADELGITLVGFMRGTTMNIYTHPERVETEPGTDDGRAVAVSCGTDNAKGLA